MKTLGKSGIRVSSIGMGCWAYGGGAYWGEQSQSDVNEIVGAALDRGINFFDTAEMYNDGASETSLGKALVGKRAMAVVATKISPANCGRDRLEKHLDASLKRLQTEYIDVYMLHWPINPKSIQHFTSDPATLANPPTVTEAFALLMEMQRKGKIRSIGVSNFGKTQLEEVLATGARIDVNEMAYNIVSRAIEKEIVPCCENNGISIVGSMALQQGLLAGLFAKPEDIPPAQVHSRHFKQERGGAQSRHHEAGAEEEIFALLAELRRMAGELNMPLAQLSLAWVLNKRFIASSLVGSRNIRELDANLVAADTVLPPDVIAAVDRLSLPVLEKLGYNADYYENTAHSRIY